MKRLKIPLIYISSFLASTLPVLIYFFVNMDKYVKTVPDRVKLCFGGIIALGIVILKVIGKLKVPSRLVGFGIVFVLCYLFNALLQDLMVFSLLALVGELLDLGFQIYLEKHKKDKENEKAAQKTAEAVERVLNGRV